MRRLAIPAAEIIFASALWNYWDQSNISAKNIARLEAIAQGPYEDLSALADLIVRVARLHPRRRKRLKFLSQEHPSLIEELVRARLIQHYENNDDWPHENDDDWPPELPWSW